MDGGDVLPVLLRRGNKPQLPFITRLFFFFVPPRAQSLVPASSFTIKLKQDKTTVNTRLARDPFFTLPMLTF